MPYLRLLLLIIGLVSATMATAKEIPLRDKIGQMLLVGFQGKTVNEQSPIVSAIENYNLGGVILFDYHYETKRFDKNIESKSQVQSLNANLQRFTQIANHTHQRASLPLLISVDYEGGKVNRLKEEYGFPPTKSPKEVGLMSDSEANDVVTRMSHTLKDAGFNLNFSPLLDVNVNQDNPIIGKLDRSFSADPNLVTHYGALYSKNFLSHGLQCAYKHFPGHGSSHTDSHLGFVDVTDTWQSFELDPYRQLFEREDACGMVMTAHIVNRQLDDSGLPATLSHKILTGLLREELRFKGVIITDDMQMKAISDHFTPEEAITLAINAGADMLIFGNQLSETPADPKTLVDTIEKAVHEGLISHQRIDDAYDRIVALKKTLAH